MEKAASERATALIIEKHGREFHYIVKYFPQSTHMQRRISSQLTSRGKLFSFTFMSVLLPSSSFTSHSQLVTIFYFALSLCRYQLMCEIAETIVTEAFPSGRMYSLLIVLLLLLLLLIVLVSSHPRQALSRNSIDGTHRRLSDSRRPTPSKQRQILAIC